MAKVTKHGAVRYTLDDVGCYVDSAQGIYMTDRVVGIANDHGAAIKPCDPADEHDHTETFGDSLYAGCEFVGDIEDEADTFMNDEYPVAGAYWGRNENGDWGLWAVEDDD